MKEYFKKSHHVILQSAKGENDPLRLIYNLLETVADQFPKQMIRPTSDNWEKARFKMLQTHASH